MLQIPLYIYQVPNSHDIHRFDATALATSREKTVLTPPPPSIVTICGENRSRDAISTKHHFHQSVRTATRQARQTKFVPLMNIPELSPRGESIFRFPASRSITPPILHFCLGILLYLAIVRTIPAPAAAAAAHREASFFVFRHGCLSWCRSPRA